MTWYGCPRTKKNSSRIIYKGGHPKIVPSEAFENYQSLCIQWIDRKDRVEEDNPINIKCLYYMETKGIVDLVGLLQATDDILTYYGVIKDDNSRIIKSHDGSRVLYDKKTPRVEITITDFKE